MHVAAFVTSHGFGHAGRASAVLDALHARRSDLTVDVYTKVQEPFLRASLRAPHRRIASASEIGIVQPGPFVNDLGATSRALEAWMDGLDRAAAEIAAALVEARTELVLCDIDALGILAAERAGIPCALVESFRWDWIYRHLPGTTPALLRVADRLSAIYPRAGLHFQVAPARDRVAGAEQIELPIARAARHGRDAARAALGLAPGERTVLITMGGVAGGEIPADLLARRSDVTFVVTGAARTERVGNALRFAQEEPLYLPDLVRASDAVVAKLGYSTLAETWREGRPLLRIPRSAWPESPSVAAWADAHVPGITLHESTVASGAWIDRLDELLAMAPAAARERAGQDEVVERILARFG